MTTTTDTNARTPSDEALSRLVEAMMLLSQMEIIHRSVFNRAFVVAATTAPMGPHGEQAKRILDGHAKNFATPEK